MGRFDDSRYVSVTLDFRCNLKCRHCMIEDTMDWLQPRSFAQLERVLDDPRVQDGRWSGIILTGGEITLFSELEAVARLARSRGVQHVRIQTHGMRLANLDYTTRLVDAGVDEFFVSLTAGTAETHDHITQVRGSFRKTLAGLENLDRFSNVSSITNTVVTRLSHRELAEVVRVTSHLQNLAQLEFWCYFAMGDADSQDMLVSHLQVQPELRAAIELAKSRGRSVTVKNYPACLLGEHRDVLQNSQPVLEIDPRFWDGFRKTGFYQCVHRDACASKSCLGLNTAYTKRFGWHESELVPLPRAG